MDANELLADWVARKERREGCRYLLDPVRHVFESGNLPVRELPGQLRECLREASGVVRDQESPQFGTATD